MYDPYNPYKEMERKQMDEIEIKVETLQEEVEKLEKKVDKILLLLQEMNKDTSSMGKHVEFVEGVYQQVKKPFHFLMGAVDSVSGLRLIRDDETTVALPGNAIAYGSREPVDL